MKQLTPTIGILNLMACLSSASLSPSPLRFFFCLLFVFFSFSLSCPDEDISFLSWKQTQNKEYSSESEMGKRETIFNANASWIRQHNISPSSFCTSLNEFADLTLAEFHQQMLTAFPQGSQLPSSSLASFDATPDSWDWRDYNVVTPPKKQGQCGSCWAFVTTGVVESYHAITQGDLVSLSEQNLMDCSYKQGNRGCAGGTMEAAYQYIIRNNGIDTELSYPYEMATTTDCRYNKTTMGATIQNYTMIQRGNETQMKEVVAEWSPVASLIDGNDPGFQFYTSGVYFNPFCSTWRMNHAVLVIGYGVDTNSTIPDYWIAKNSYGTTWGDGGYINMARNQNNNCGIATKTSFPIPSST